MGVVRVSGRGSLQNNIDALIEAVTLPEVLLVEYRDQVSKLTPKPLYTLETITPRLEEIRGVHNFRSKICRCPT